MLTYTFPESTTMPSAKSACWTFPKSEDRFATFRGGSLKSNSVSLKTFSGTQHFSGTFSEDSREQPRTSMQPRNSSLTSGEASGPSNMSSLFSSTLHSEGILEITSLILLQGNAGLHRMLTRRPVLQTRRMPFNEELGATVVLPGRGHTSCDIRPKPCYAHTLQQATLETSSHAPCWLWLQG